MNPNRFVNQTHHCALGNNRGRDIAALPALAEERAFIRAIIQGLDDIKAGRTYDLTAAKNRLGIV